MGLIPILVPYNNERVWHGSSFAYEMFPRDDVCDWLEDQAIPRRIYKAAIDDCDDSGVFLFDCRVDAVLFSLEWL